MFSEEPLTTADVPPQFLKAVYMVGHVPPRALASDPRISYSLYIPAEKYHASGTPGDSSGGSGGPGRDNDDEDNLLPLLVYIHGTRRDTSALHGELAALADAAPCAVLAPLFPAGLDGPNDLDSYKLLRSATLRSDAALLSALDEVARRWPGIRTGRFALAGWSGGAQFAHRFLYLHPERVACASIGAPGRVTFLDRARKWPAGIADAEALFGRGVDMDALRKVEIQLVVGGADVDVPGGGKEFWDWVEGVRARRRGEGSGLGDAKESDDALAGRGSRFEVLKQLWEAWKRDGIEAQFDVVEGVSHNESGVRGTMLRFLQSRM